MSGFVGYGLKGLAAGAKALKNVFKPQKVSPTITKVDPFVPKNKKEKLARDYGVAQRKRKASEVKLDNTVFRINQEAKKLKEGRVYSGKELEQQKYFNDMNKNKKAKGGRAGFKRGTGLIPKKKSNVEKIKKSFGTLSVRAGIDNNPNPTYADKIAGAKMKNKKTKKKVI